MGLLILIAASMSSLAQTNSWTGTVTGAWENLTWSLGMRPAISQSAIVITNYGQKAIIIGANTVNNYPGTLSISNLTIGGTPLSTNTLLLNFTGTAHPLQVKDSLTVLSNSVLLNLNGMIRVDGTNPFTSVDGVINQDGGSNVFPGAIALGVHNPGYYNLTNGTLVCGRAYVGFLSGPTYYDGAITQSGGLAQFDSLDLAGTYNISNGTFSAGSVEIGATGSGFFNQVGGNAVVTNSISIGVAVAGNSSGGNWTMQNGTLSTPLIALGYGNGRFTQVSGTVRVGAVETSGIDDEYDYPSSGEYLLQGGQLFVDNVLLNGPFGNFTQSGGILSVSGEISGAFTQTGGIAYCSTADYGYNFFSLYPYGPTFQLVNATNIVTNSLSIGSYDNLTFNFQSGLLQCSNLVLGNCQFNFTGGRLVEQGSVQFEGCDFSCGVTNQAFGPLILSGPDDSSSIKFATNPCVITFQDSSTLPWSSSQPLTVYGWQGSTNGGGSTRLYVGNSDHGLTPAQLAQINFNGTQFARQLPSGEIVPTDQPTMNISVVQTNVVISWPAPFISSLHLQSATNVVGPYVDVTNTYNPFTIGPGLSRQFFRLH